MTTGHLPAATPAAPDDVDPATAVDRAFLAIAVELIAEGWPDREPRDRPEPARTPPRTRCAVGCAPGARPGPGRRTAGRVPRVRRARGARRCTPRERSPPGRHRTVPTPRGGESEQSTVQRRRSTTNRVPVTARLSRATDGPAHDPGGAVGWTGAARHRPATRRKTPEDAVRRPTP